MRAEERTGAHPEEVPGEGDRVRDRERSSEESQSAETTESVDVTVTAVAAADGVETAASPMAGDGFVARVRAWFRNAFEVLGLS
jgi:hypothetical protein